MGLEASGCDGTCEVSHTVIEAGQQGLAQPADDCQIVVPTMTRHITRYYLCAVDVHASGHDALHDVGADLTRPVRTRHRGARRHDPA